MGSLKGLFFQIQEGISKWQSLNLWASICALGLPFTRHWRRVTIIILKPELLKHNFRKICFYVFCVAKVWNRWFNCCLYSRGKDFISLPANTKLQEEVSGNPSIFKITWLLEFGNTIHTAKKTVFIEVCTSDLCWS